jgi:hypothetical protein
LREDVAKPAATQVSDGGVGQVLDCSPLLESPQAARSRMALAAPVDDRVLEAGKPPKDLAAGDNCHAE